MVEMLKVFSRINATSDGQDLVAFLKNLSKETYDQWKKTDSSLNDIFKGQLVAIDDLIKVIETADEKLNQILEAERRNNEEYIPEHHPSF